MQEMYRDAQRNNKDIEFSVIGHDNLISCYLEYDGTISRTAIDTVPMTFSTNDLA